MVRKSHNQGRAGTLRSLAGRPLGTPGLRRGFTLMEIVVAVGAVALVSVGIASIFDTVGKTVIGGKRISNLNTYAGLLESQMRADFEAMSRDGFMVVRQQYVDTDGDGKYNAAADRVPVSAMDVTPRGRRIDEVLFFINGRFTSAREPLFPGVQANSKQAMVWYGHGQTSPWLNETDHSADPDPMHPGFHKLPINPAQVVANRNDSVATRLGVLAAGQLADANPNYYAGDWTLLRHLTLLCKPTGVDEAVVPPGASVFGVNSSDPRPGPRSGHAIVADRETQISLQPAASSVFRSLQWYYPDPQFIPQNTLRTQADGSFSTPFLASGAVDVAATDLNEVRGLVTTGAKQFGAPLTYPSEIAAPLRFQLVTQRTFFPVSETSSNNYRFARPLPANYNDLDHMHAWMQDAMPTDSRNDVTRAAGNDIPPDPDDVGVLGTRVRYEPQATDLLPAMQLPKAVTTPTNADYLRLAEYRADQLMLTRGILVPHCSEFIVEWSFGQLDVNGDVVWHGPDRAVAGGPTVHPYPRDTQNLDRSQLTVVGQLVNTSNGQISPAFHPATDRLIYGFTPKGDEACLTSYFGWTDPTYVQPTATPPGTAWLNQTPPPTMTWPWPKLVRVTITLSDPQDPTIESTFQYVFHTPDAK
jgi:hypothetical protein